jgi:O-antigen/teichoic acid export membrane protein
MTQLVAPAQLGYYVVAAGLSGAILPVVHALSAVAFSRMSRTRSNDARGDLARDALAWMFWILIAGGLLGYVAAEPLILLLFGEPYREAVRLFRVLCLATPFAGANQIIGPLLQGAGRPLISGAAEAIGAALTVSLLVAMLPTRGAMGAAITSLVACASTFAIALAALAMTTRTSIGLLLLPRWLGARVDTDQGA